MKYSWIIILIGAAALSGCGKGAEEGMPPANAILARAVKESVKDTVELVGSISARDEITIISELDSTVTTINVKEGQHVKKGEKLFELDDVRSGASLAEAQAAYKLAQLSHKRNEGLLKNDTISQQTYDEGEADLKSKKARLDLAKDNQSKAVITAAFAGMAGERSVSSGQFVTRGQKLLTLVKTDPLDIVGDIPERYTAGLANGLKVEFKTDAYPEKSFSALVIYVSPTLDPSSRTVRIKAEVSNGDGLLRPGMFGRMSIVMEQRDDSLVIPESCIQMQGSNKMLVRVTKEGISEFASVTTGRRFKSRVEILSGLEEGDLVVVEGWQKMGPGMSVIAAPESADYGVTPGPVSGDAK
jgi:membrane fusion protein (multidrug efflux system)